MTRDRNHEWSPRAQALTENEHLREQAARVHKILEIVRGTKDCPTYEQTVQEVARLVALVEVTGVKRTANVGGIIVERGPMEGYSVSVHTADVYVLHLAGSDLTTYKECQEFWHREPQEDA